MSISKETLESWGFSSAIATKLASIFQASMSDVLNLLFDGDGNRYVKTTYRKWLGFFIDDVQWLRVRRDQNYETNKILEVTIPGSDGANDKFIYVTACDYVDVGAYPRGATLELSGNDATPEASRGVCHLFTGANPNGRIGLNVMHAEGQIHALDVVTTTIAYQPSTGLVDLSRDVIFRPVASTPYKIKQNIGVKRAVQTGTNARAGVSTLVGGTVTVANTSVTANTVVMTQRKTTGGTLGHLTYTVSAATSFTITSSSGTDTSTVNWELVEQEA